MCVLFWKKKGKLKNCHVSMFERPKKGTKHFIRKQPPHGRKLRKERGGGEEDHSRSREGSENSSNTQIEGDYRAKEEKGLKYERRKIDKGFGHGRI